MTSRPGLAGKCEISAGAVTLLMASVVRVFSGPWAGRLHVEVFRFLSRDKKVYPVAAFLHRIRIVAVGFHDLTWNVGNFGVMLAHSGSF